MDTLNPRPNPYVGPRSFQTGENLYGRDREARELLNLLIAERIVLLHSPSGAGKSSLVQAGLIPRLAQAGFEVLPVIRVNLELPAGSLDAPGFNRYAFSVMLSLEEGRRDAQPAAPAAELAQLSLSQYLSRLSTAEPETDPETRDTQVLLFDQFEEVLTLDSTDRDAKLEFFDQLGAALRERRRWALFVMREDYLPALDPYLRPIPTRLSTTYRLDFLGVDAARQAIQQPAQTQGVAFAASAVTRLVNDLRQVQVQQPDGAIEIRPGPYVEPVQLQVVCYNLWQHLADGQTSISEEDLASIGNVDQSLAQYYAERVAWVAATIPVRERRVREWFDRRLITEGGFRNQVLMEADLSAGLDNRAIRLLEDAHLIRAEKRLGATWFELAHDRLIQPVRTDNAAWSLEHLSLLERQASLWDYEDRPAHLLLRDQVLADAETWAASHPDEVTSTELDFLAACRELNAREQAERERAEQAVKLEAAQKVAEAERQRAEDQTLAARKLRQRAIFLMIAFLAAVVMTIVAGFLGNRAISESQAANTARVVAEEQRNLANAQSTLAVGNAATAEYERGRAEAQQATAESASVLAIEQANTAVAAQSTAVESARQVVAAQDEIELQRDTALSRQLAALALNYLTRRQDLSFLLGIKAYQTRDTQEARSSLLLGLQRGLSQDMRPYGPPIPENNSSVYGIDLSSDGARLAWGGEDGVVTIWNYQQRMPEHRLSRHAARIWSVAFSPDGKTLATAGDDTWIYLWDVESGEFLQEIPNLNRIVSMSWSPDGQFISVASGPSVVVWKVFEGGAVLPDIRERDRIMLRNLGYDINAVDWSPDGRMIAAAASNFYIYTLDPFTGDTIGQYAGHQAKVLTVAWSADGKRLASGGEDLAVIIWDAASYEGVRLEGHTDRILDVTFSFNGQLLASSSDVDDRRVLIWDVQTGAIKTELSEFTNPVESLAFSPASGDVLLAIGSRDRSIKLYEAVLQQPLSQPLPAGRAGVLGLGIAADGAPLLARYRDNMLNTYRLVSGEEQPLGENLSNFKVVSSAAYSHDGARLALGLETGVIQVLDAATGQEQASFQAASSPILSLAFAPDGGTLASAHCEATEVTAAVSSCADGRIRLWSPDGAAAPGGVEPAGAPTFITALAFSPDGATLASGGQDRLVLLWDLASGQAKGLPLARHLGGISSLAFSPDGKTLASGSDDQSVVLWDAATYQPIGAGLSGSTGAISALAFSPTSQALYSGHGDGTGLMWDVDPQSWIARACSLAGRNFTANEWEQFFPGQPYSPACEQFPLETPAAPTPTPSS